MEAGPAEYALSFGGGIVSFLSPCVLPLVPAYLSVVTGLDVAEVQAGSREHLGRIVRDTLKFVAGFAAVFILLGLTATEVGHTLLSEHLLATRVSGIVVVAMAALLAGSLFLRWPGLYRDVRFHPRPSALGKLAAPLTGAAFGFGWTPCIGPVLASVLVVAGAQGQAVRGALLLACYAAGMGCCFLAAGLAAGHLSRAFSRVRRHLRAVTLGSSAVMAFFGVMIALNRIGWVTGLLQGGLAALGLSHLNYLG